MDFCIKFYLSDSREKIPSVTSLFSGDRVAIFFGCESCTKIFFTGRYVAFRLSPFRVHFFLLVRVKRENYKLELFHFLCLRLFYASFGNIFSKSSRKIILEAEGVLLLCAIYMPGSRNCAAGQQTLQIILDLANRSSKRNII